MKKLFILLIFIFTLGFAQEKPKPFGIELGVFTKEQTLQVIKKEGGKVVESGYRIIKGNITNPNVEGIKVEGLPVDNLSHALFWFYQGRLFQITYVFPLSMEKEEFYVLYRQLESKYGKPKKYVKPWLADGVAQWDFKDVRVRLIAPWVSRSMYLHYEHLPLSKQADQSDEEVLRRETSKPRRGL